MTKLLRDFEIYSIIEGKLEENNQCIIAIDGRCGAGKSTFAENLSQRYGFNIIHMDDFFLPLNLRTEQRLSEIGGNVHYERFFDEVIKNIRKKSNFSYKKFDCKILDYSYNVDIDINKPIIIEGAYSMRDDFIKYYDMKIFVDIDEKTQKERIINRNGSNKYEDFKNLWIPKEENYLEKFDIKNKCDYVLKLTN